MAWGHREIRWGLGGRAVPSRPMHARTHGEATKSVPSICLQALHAAHDAVGQDGDISNVRHAIPLVDALAAQLLGVPRKAMSRGAHD